MVRYRIIGDDSATTFFDIDQNFGNVTLKSSVNFDTTSNYKVHACTINLKKLSISFYILEFLSLLSHVYGCWLSKFSNPTLNYLLQIRVQAYDGGLPSLSATATIDVLVQRNLYSPVFSVLNYEVTINENAALGVPFVYVNATDADIRVFDVDWHVTNFLVFLWCNFTMYRVFIYLWIYLQFTMFGVFKYLWFYCLQSPHNVIRFSATGTSSALEFFQINPIDGGVSVKKSLTTVSNRNINQYSVSNLIVIELVK